MSRETLSPEAVRTLVDNHERFLRFLRKRVGSRDAAEDILQSAFVRSLEKGRGLRAQESSVAWFYRVLRNALTDHYRRQAAEGRALKGRAATHPDGHDAELERTVCACIEDLIGTLKPEYAEILRKVDLEGAAIRDLAAREGIKPNNAMVRLHRARKALHGRLVQSCGTCTTHGCLECTCSC